MVLQTTHNVMQPRNDEQKCGLGGRGCAASAGGPRSRKWRPTAKCRA